MEDLVLIPINFIYSGVGLTHTHKSQTSTWKQAPTHMHTLSPQKQIQAHADTLTQVMILDINDDKINFSQRSLFIPAQNKPSLNGPTSRRYNKHVHVVGSLERGGVKSSSVTFFCLSFPNFMQKTKKIPWANSQENSGQTYVCTYGATVDILAKTSNFPPSSPPPLWPN